MRSFLGANAGRAQRLPPRLELGCEVDVAAALGAAQRFFAQPLAE
ncbi:MAG: hypothetical protein ACHQDD_00135 [Steroidobacterales bacterium]